MTQVQGSYTGKAVGELLDNLFESGNFTRYNFTIVTLMAGNQKIEFSSRKMTRLEKVEKGYNLAFAPVQRGALDWGQWDFVWSEDNTLPGRPILEISVAGTL